MLSHGYGDDLKSLLALLPRIVQTCLVSATMSSDVQKLKAVVMNQPAIVKVKEEKKVGVLKQFYLALTQKDKNLVIYVFLKLGVVKQPCIFFCNSVEGCYKVKLLLEQFGIRSAVVNSRMPGKVRRNVVEKFNNGGVGILVCQDLEGEEAEEEEEEEDDDVEGSDDVEEEDSDEDGDGSLEGEGDLRNSDSDSSDNDDDEEDDDKDEEESEGEVGAELQKKKKGKKLENVDKAAGSTKKAKTSKKKNSEVEEETDFGFGRGIDFRGVKFVVNVDFPPSAASYTHRIGRTARAGASGCALTLVNREDAQEIEMLQEIQATQPPLPLPKATDEIQGEAFSPQPAPLAFDLREIEGFRYRVEDVTRAVTNVAVKETIKAELKEQILNNERLQQHFAENPKDLQILQHDKTRTHISKVQQHLSHVPNYLLPVGMQVVKKMKRSKRRSRNRGGDGGRNTTSDPLQNFGESDAKKPKTSSEESRVFLDTGDGTGRSTSGRQRWKEKRGKGKFSKKSKGKR